MEERITKLETVTEYNSKEIEKLSGKIDNITELTIAVKEIATEVKIMREEVTKLTTRVDQIEKEPAQDYKEIKKNIVKQVVTFIVGAVISGIAVFLAK
jgi:uncharacterized coiled-coil protein SlyX